MNKTWHINNSTILVNWNLYYKKTHKDELEKLSLDRKKITMLEITTIFEGDNLQIISISKHTLWITNAIYCSKIIFHFSKIKNTLWIMIWYICGKYMWYKSFMKYPEYKRLLSLFNNDRIGVVVCFVIFDWKLLQIFT